MKLVSYTTIISPLLRFIIVINRLELDEFQIINVGVCDCFGKRSSNEVGVWKTKNLKNKSTNGRN